MAGTLLLLLPLAGHAREPGDPIRLEWSEGDLAGYTTIYGPDGKEAVGVVEYVQRRRGDVLEARRVAYFVDGSRDEDRAEARVGRTLRTVGGGPSSATPPAARSSTSRSTSRAVT